jgi:ribosomal protein S18 acetylase RimI-like enzyme
MSAPPSQPDRVAAFQLVPACQFTIEQLTAAYNQTRVDYLVPMPMNAARLADYIHVYDVDLDRSFVAVADGQTLGLGMLGVRPGRTWITRLGVLPVRRRRGVGRAITQALLGASEALGAGLTLLEVIKNNDPAYNLFVACGFQVTRELVVLRRPPGPPPQPPAGEVRRLDRAEVQARLAQRPPGASWVTQTESLLRAEGLMGLALSLPDGGQGWLIFQQQRHGRFLVILSRLTLHTEQGDPVVVGRELLAHLHHRYPELDTHTENIPISDPHLPPFFDLNYVEAFRRIEMRRQLVR